jgi:hypothetical protein
MLKLTTVPGWFYSEHSTHAETLERQLFHAVEQFGNTSDTVSTRSVPAFRAQAGEQIFPCCRRFFFLWLGVAAYHGRAKRVAVRLLSLWRCSQRAV